MASELESILGISTQEAEGLLAMSNGDVQLAISLFLGDAPPAAAQQPSAHSTAPPSGNSAAQFVPPYPHWDVIWPQHRPIPASWAGQRLDDLTPQGGIKQP